MLWSVWILSAVFLARWIFLWRGERRARLRFALTAPIGAIVGVIIGLLSVSASMDDASCFGRNCRGDVSNFTASLDANAGLGGLIVANSVLGLITAAALAVITLVVETVLMVRRHERAQRDESSM
ncbi:hypothetical protein ACTI_21080 [Actinoplanes sp. OR16]|uniref:hypothetical protein n=1 Tax=Actinoplanes sp. OR16 TaxID=946334 RepID=UPI000F6E1407|nr:hypothetical protein [Actinoplanes sp. OR16]BBH65423.1 hypothetical protein ACTI_21080 [Actinoplanes sp. OR16]